MDSFYTNSTSICPNKLQPFSNSVGGEHAHMHTLLDVISKPKQKTTAFFWFACFRLISFWHSSAWLQSFSVSVQERAANIQVVWNPCTLPQDFQTALLQYTAGEQAEMAQTLAEGQVASGAKPLGLCCQKTTVCTHVLQWTAMKTQPATHMSKTFILNSMHSTVNCIWTNLIMSNGDVTNFYASQVWILLPGELKAKVTQTLLTVFIYLWFKSSTEKASWHDYVLYQTWKQNPTKQSQNCCQCLLHIDKNSIVT